MFSHPVKNKKGMALLLVISLVSVLAVVTLQFSRTMRQEYIVSAGLKNSVKLGEMARSGIVIGEQMLLLDLEENEFDSHYDSWAQLTDEDFTSLFDEGNVTIDVTDETGKFQINAMVIGKKKGKKAKTKAERDKQAQRESAVRNVLWRLLRAEPFLVEDGVARGIIDSLIDWIDSGDGDGEEEFGAEDSYYQSLSPPYPCKNGPVESIRELLQVKGITPELLYGTEEKPALAPLLTVLGDDGKININSADVLLLQALGNDIGKNVAENMIEFREDEENRDQLANAQWYKQVPSFPGDIAETIKKQDLTTIVSNYFSIDATAVLNTQQKTITATVQREDKETSILRWDSE